MTLAVGSLCPSFLTLCPSLAPPAHPEHALNVGIDAGKALRCVWQLPLDLLAAYEQRLQVGPGALDLGQKLEG
jgi:hypothetical protein